MADKEHIPFNRPYHTGNETDYIIEAVKSGKLSGDGTFTKKCQLFFEERYNFPKVLLTNSCTAALEMAAMLINIGPGDEVIMPSYTFVSTANAFVLRGADIVFCDSGDENPNIDPDLIENLITKKTKAIICVHYAGVACDMDKIMAIAEKHNIIVVEDAAQAIDSYYNDKPLGGIGHLAAFSFHETKNLICGEGGMLAINDKTYIERAEIIWEKGTNRAAFFRGEIDKYSWIDIGSSFLPSELTAAFLYAQTQHLSDIQQRRAKIWRSYYNGLKEVAGEATFKLPDIPKYATNNAHMFYLVCGSSVDQKGLLKLLNSESIYAVFHYLSLHKSSYFQNRYRGAELINSDRYSDMLVRLPFYYEITNDQISRVVEAINQYYTH